MQKGVFYDIHQRNSFFAENFDGDLEAVGLFFTKRGV